MKLLSDRIQEFIDWLENNTDFGAWDDRVKTEVHKHLIVYLISDSNPDKDLQGLIAKWRERAAEVEWNNFVYRVYSNCADELEALLTIFRQTQSKLLSRIQELEQLEFNFEKDVNQDKNNA